MSAGVQLRPHAPVGVDLVTVPEYSFATHDDPSALARAAGPLPVGIAAWLLRWMR